MWQDIVPVTSGSGKRRQLDCDKVQSDPCDEIRLTPLPTLPSTSAIGLDRFLVKKVPGNCIALQRPWA
jgi:hypothetical protein